METENIILALIASMAVLLNFTPDPYTPPYLTSHALWGMDYSEWCKVISATCAATVILKFLADIIIKVWRKLSVIVVKMWRTLHKYIRLKGEK